MDYPGVNKPLTVENAIEIISRLHSLYSNFPYDIDETKLHNIIKGLKDHVWKYHLNHFYIAEPFTLGVFVGLLHTFLGGQDWTKSIGEVERITKEALRQLSKNGKAEQISKDEWEKHPIESEDKWRIPPPCQRVLGEGNSWAYLYYFDKEKAEAQDHGRKVWPCKIGFTENEPENRIQQQMEENSDIPIIALLLRTDNAKFLERIIHGILTLHGKHIVENTQSREWFRTNPEEVVSIYKLITDWEPQITA